MVCGLQMLITNEGASHCFIKLKYSICLVYFIALESLAMKINKPEYYLKLDMENTPYLVLVNGVELERDFEGYSLEVEIPINHLIRNGMNEFTLSVPPEEYHDGDFEPPVTSQLEVWVKGQVSEKAVEFKVADIVHVPEIVDGKYEHSLGSMAAGTYSFDGQDRTFRDDEGSITVGEISVVKDHLGKGGDSISREFSADVNFPDWMFFSGERFADLPFDSDERYDSAESLVMPQLKKLQDLFETRDVEKILKVFEARSAEYDIAFYKEPGTTIKELENSIRNTFESDYPQVIKDENKMQLVVSSDGRVATIVNAGSMNGTIRFDAGDDFVISYNACWIRKDGEWIIAR